ncbi:MAG: MBL fold metallo-hydrolase [Saprospiraceae bacterium]|nr:MBL fold metallo-hydrolase [Saprospiraceae bacterium]
MNIQLIRNATLKIEYAGKTILVDPMLSPRGSFESFAGIEHNPIVDLPMEVEEILNGVEMVLVTHTHEDHFDEGAKKLLPSDIKLFCQPPDREKIKDFGFENVEVIEYAFHWEGIKIIRTGGKHGSGEILKHMGHVSGFILKSEGEPTIYIIGDSLLVNEVEENLAEYQPEVVVTNSGSAYIPGFETTPILMGIPETIKVCKMLPESAVVAVHMEALDHCTLTRDALRSRANYENIKQERLLIPGDGEVLIFG